MRRRILLGLLAVAGLASLTWAIGTKEQWDPELADDPANRSGRASVCKALVSQGHRWLSQVQDLGPRPFDRGVEHETTRTFDASPFAGGVIDVCSEYGFVKLAGIDGAQGRVSVTLSNPFPGGARAVDDTRVTTELGVIDGRLQIRVRQLTQGVTSFQSFFAKGSRPAAVNVVVQVPRSGAYELQLTANHHRMTIRNLDVRGVLEGYASPGADIDAGLDGPLTVKVSGVSYQAKWAGSSNLAGGTTARLRPLRSSEVELNADEGRRPARGGRERRGARRHDERAGPRHSNRPNRHLRRRSDHGIDAECWIRPGCYDTIRMNEQSFWGPGKLASFVALSISSARKP